MSLHGIKKECNPNENVNDTKKPKIEKTLPILLQEVSNGSDVDFKAWLAQEEITDLNLHNKAENINLFHLGKALVGTKVTKVNLGANSIGLEDAKIFFEELVGSGVVAVCLTKNNINNIKEQGGRDLGGSVNKSKVISIDLSQNNIGNEGAKSFLEAIRNSAVTSIEMSFCELGSEGAKAVGEGLKGSNVIMLDLYGNNIEAQGLQDLLVALKETQVASLNVTLNDINEDATFDAVSSTQLTKLKIASNDIGNEGAIALAHGLKNSKLKTVDLRDNNLSGEGIEGFLKLLKGTTVVKVKLNNSEDNNKLSPLGLESLSQYIEGTSLLKIEGCEEDDFYDEKYQKGTSELKRALVKNQNKLLLPAYLMMTLAYKMQDKKKIDNLLPLPCSTPDENPLVEDKDNVKRNDILIAGGILANLPSRVGAYILSFLPFMETTAERYRVLAQKYHRDYSLVLMPQPKFELNKIYLFKNKQNTLCFQQLVRKNNNLVRRFGDTHFLISGNLTEKDVIKHKKIIIDKIDEMINHKKNIAVLNH